MIRRPVKQDYLTIAHYTGTVTIGIGLLFIVPLATAAAFAEWNTALDFVNGMAVTLLVGTLLTLIKPTRNFAWQHGMVTAAFSWLFATFLAALPYYFSGHYLHFLDAVFDVMSGYTTTGLTLVQDLDHLSRGLNMWRHLLTYVGGQGMVVLALTFLVKESAGGLKLYVGEAKDERLLPNVVHTAQAIWQISLVYLVLGTAALWVNGMLIGLKPLSAFLHALWMYMAAWSTGGFAPTSLNIIYYHSLSFEVVTIIFFVLGSFNFALHYAALTGQRKEVYRNVENMSLFITLSLTTLLASVALIRSGVYTQVGETFRRVFYNIISAHTTTGFQSIYARQLLQEWSPLGIIAISIAMLIGGSACSTAGGFKGLRVGTLATALVQDTRRLLAPESAVIVAKIHHVRDIVLHDKQVRASALIVLSYLGLFATGVTLTALAGFSLPESVFEAASVTGNVGLSIGVTSAAMPAFLKVFYIFAMWIARLEFLAVYVFLGFLWSGVKRR